MPPPVISLAVPFYNEEDGIDIFFSRVEGVLEGMALDYEIVCVNDGSRDRTLELLLAHRARNPRIVVVDLSRNFGKDIALTAAIDHATGQAVVPMDADLQDPPELLPQLVAKWREGFDMVIARRKSRESDTMLKRLSAGWFYKLFNKLTSVPIPQNAGDFRLMDRKVVDAVKQLPEGNRFMKGLFAWVGFRQAEIEYVRPPREKGATKFNYWKLWNFALDGIFSFSSVPLRIWGYIGLTISGFSLLYAIVLIARTLVFGRDVPGYASLMVAILFMGGIQLLSLGIIGEYIGRIYNETKRRPLYLVREPGFLSEAASVPLSSPPRSSIIKGVITDPSWFFFFRERKTWAMLSLAAAIGAVFAFSAIGWRGISASANDGLSDINGDRLNGNIGINYFVQDEWRFPLFDTAGLNDDNGANIIFTDSLPAVALMLKLTHPFIGGNWDPFGLWFWLCLTLQALAMVYLLRQASLKGLVHTVVGALFGVVVPVVLFRYRFEHIGLCSHFLIIFALALFIRSKKNGRLISSLWLFAALSLFSLLIHAYLWAMVTAIAGAAVLQAIFDGRREKAALGLWSASFAGLTLVLMFASGYLTGTFTGRSGGFGFYSANLMSAFWPQTGLFFGDGRILDATGGQYEGFGYLGLGTILLVSLAVLFRLRDCLGMLRRNAGLLIVCAAFLVFAASNVIWAGHWNIASVNLPDGVGNLCSVFRSSGRFIWPLVYLVSAAGLIILFRTHGRRFALFAALSLALIQLVDAGREISLVRSCTGPSSDDSRRCFLTARKLVSSHAGADFFPELVLTPDEGARREAQRIILACSVGNKPSSSAVFARPAKGDPDVDGSVDLAEKVASDGRVMVFMPPFTAVAVEKLAGVKPVRRGSLLLVGKTQGWREEVLRDGVFSEVSEPEFPTGRRISGMQMCQWMVEDMGEVGDAGWTIGKNTDWFIPLKGLSTAFQFDVECLPFVSTSLTVFANGVEIHSATIEAGDFRSISVTVPETALTSDGILHVRFALAAAPSPKSLGKGADDRSLGLLIKSFTLMPIGAEVLAN